MAEGRGVDEVVPSSVPVWCFQKGQPNQSPLASTELVVRPEYVSHMIQHSMDINLCGVDVVINSRMYDCEDSSSFSSEIEFEETVTDRDVRKVAMEIARVVGTDRTMSRKVDTEYMREIRNSDHDVVDVSDIRPYKGTNMVKVDGMKVYVFSYQAGYVVTYTDNDLSVIRYSMFDSYDELKPISTRPDVVVAEAIDDGSLVYIDYLTSNGTVVNPVRAYKKIPPLNYATSHMIVRKSWTKWDDVPNKPITNLPIDGMVCVTDFRTLRLKEPTVDLLFDKGFLYMSDETGLIRVAKGSDSMTDGTIYEFSVSPGPTSNQVLLSKGVIRTVKKRPNRSDIVRRAFVSVSMDKKVNTVLYDVTSMSFRMRNRVYEDAQSYSVLTRKVIVIFGAGRFQEINEMRTDKYSYVAVDPHLDVTKIVKRLKRLRVIPYDKSTDMSKQIPPISNRPGNLLYYRGTSETFLSCPGVISCMASMGIPGVFSFSLSYHSSVIAILAESGVAVYGCGYVHDNMSRDGVGSPPVTMKVEDTGSGSPVVRSVFGKSEWLEPVLLSNSVRNLRSIREAMPELWRNIDSSTYEIMSRAVIMYA